MTRTFLLALIVVGTFSPIYATPVQCRATSVDLEIQNGSLPVISTPGGTWLMWGVNRSLQTPRIDQNTKFIFTVRTECPGIVVDLRNDLCAGYPTIDFDFNAGPSLASGSGRLILPIGSNRQIKNVVYTIHPDGKGFTYSFLGGGTESYPMMMKDPLLGDPLRQMRTLYNNQSASVWMEFSGMWSVSEYNPNPCPSRYEVYFGGTFAISNWMNNDHNGFILKLYTDILSHPPDDATRLAYVDRLNRGLKTREMVAREILMSAERAQFEVNKMYERHLGRAADSGAQGFINAYVAGESLESIRAAILASSEYFTVAGGTPDTFMKFLYKDLLNREPDPGSISAYSGYARGGEAERRTLALIILRAPEYTDGIVSNWYQKYIFRNRPPTGPSTNAATYSALLRDPSGGRQVALSKLLGSSEYNP